MILIDAGPLFSLVDDEKLVERRAIRAFMNRTSEGILTTLPAFTEAIYLAGRRGGLMQETLWDFWNRNVFAIAPLDDNMLLRSQRLMSKYKSRPMDFADATLVMLAEATGIRRIITIDSDFYIYRIHDKETFDVINPLA